MSYTNDPKKWRNEIIGDLKASRKDFASGISSAAKKSFRQVQQVSRVRTGNFISNWNFSIDNPDLAYVERKVLKFKSANLRKAASKIDAFDKRRTDEKAMYMANAAPYGNELDRNDKYIDKAIALIESAVEKIK